MDWDTDILNDITIRVKFCRGDKLMYECVTWIGFVGIMTGCSHQNEQLSMISLNFRKENNSILRNIYRYVALFNPTSFAIRRYLQTGNDKLLSQTIAPCYLTIGTKDKIQIYEYGKYINTESYDFVDNCLKGIRNNPIIKETRKTLVHANNNLMNVIKKRNYFTNPDAEKNNNNLKFLVKTNNDFSMTLIDKKWADNDFLLLNTLERQETAISELEKRNNEQLNFDLCFEIMETEPVKNVQTVYTTIMCLDRNANEIALQVKVYNS